MDLGGVEEGGGGISERLSAPPVVAAKCWFCCVALFWIVVLLINTNSSYRGSRGWRRRALGQSFLSFTPNTSSPPSEKVCTASYCMVGGPGGGEE